MYTLDVGLNHTRLSNPPATKPAVLLQMRLVKIRLCEDPIMVVQVI